MRFGTIHTICSRIRITNDTQGKKCLVFRTHPSLTSKHHQSAVPYVSADGEDPALRYYFCGPYLVPLNLYLPYLEATKDLSDSEAAKYTDDRLDDQGRVLSYRLESENLRPLMYPKAHRAHLLDKCIIKMLQQKLPATYIADILMIGTVRVNKLASRMFTDIVTQENPSRAKAPRIAVPEDIKAAPELNAVKKAAAYARVRAAQSGVAASFSLADVFPTMYDINGDSGRHNGIKVMVKVCPVLRVPLDYNVFENNKQLNSIRVWRKAPGPDGKAAMTADNVTIMSKLAADLIEGVQGAKKLQALGGDALVALTEWQDKYGRREVFDRPVGRPKKVRNAHE